MPSVENAQVAQVRTFAFAMRYFRAMAQFNWIKTGKHTRSFTATDGKRTLSGRISRPCGKKGVARHWMLYCPEIGAHGQVFCHTGVAEGFLRDQAETAFKQQMRRHRNLIIKLLQSK